MRNFLFPMLLAALAALILVFHTVYSNRLTRYSFIINRLEEKKRKLEEEILKLELEKERRLSLTALKVEAEKNFERINPEEVLVLVWEKGRWVIKRRER